MLKSSLSPDRVNSLPNVVHRPQESGGNKYVSHNRDNRSFETHDHQPKSFESFYGSTEKEFGDRLTDNFYQTSKFVTKYNHNQRKDASEVDKARRSYYETMLDFNLCWKCRLPIRVKSACIKPPSEPRTADQILGRAAVPVRGESIPANKKQRRSVSNDLWKHEFTTMLFKPHQDVKNVMYADIRTHFEIFQKADGSLYYLLIDRPKKANGMPAIQIEVRYRTYEVKRKKRIFGKQKNVTRQARLPYFVEVYEEDGIVKERKIIPNSSYRMVNQKCEHKAR